MLRQVLSVLADYSPNVSLRKLDRKQYEFILIMAKQLIPEELNELIQEYLTDGVLTIWHITSHILIPTLMTSLLASERESPSYFLWAA